MACKAEQERECLIQERDAAWQEAARARSKKQKKKTKDRSSAKFNAKLNLLTDKFGIDFDGLDSSDSEVDPLEAKQRKEEKRSEFDEYRIKKSPPEYFGMCGEGLRRHFKVDKNMHNKIVKNEFFKLNYLAKFLIMRRSTRTSGDETSKEKQSIPNLFKCLYLYGMYYLQAYPEKTLGFLDYCSTLSGYAWFCSPEGLLCIDAELRGWYVAHPEHNWSQDNFEVIDIKTELAGDESVSRKANNCIGGMCGRGAPQMQGLRGISRGCGHGRGSFRGGNQGRAVGSSGTSRPALSSQICDRFNCGECMADGCPHVHICYCHDPTHCLLNYPKLGGTAAI